MNLLLILLSVMTFTVETRTTVSKSGQCPSEMEVSYDCSYQKGQVRKDDVATLTVSGLGGIVVEQVEVYVKSNKNEGAGTFEVQMNGNKVSTKSGSLKNWVGTFDNQNYHAVSLLDNSVPHVKDLKIRLTGTENSLYIEKYVITYIPAPAYTVTLMNGDAESGTMREEAGGQGVLLPSMPDMDEWQFIGWTETPFESQSTALTSFYPSGTKYCPGEDVTLWAVYEYQPEPRDYATELVSGDYIYVNITDQKTMCGLPDNGMMDICAVDMKDATQYYSITFNATGDSATIQYAGSETYIGFSGSKLEGKLTACRWCVFHEGNRTAFYTTVNQQTYLLYPGCMDGAGLYMYTGLIPINNIPDSPTALLFVGPQTEEPLYSCFPQRLQAIEKVGVEGREVTVPFGIYELRIRDGHKQLRIR